MALHVCWYLRAVAADAARGRDAALSLTEAVVVALAAADAGATHPDWAGRGAGRESNRFSSLYAGPDTVAGGGAAAAEATPAAGAPAAAAATGAVGGGGSGSSERCSSVAAEEGRGGGESRGVGESRGGGESGGGGESSCSARLKLSLGLVGRLCAACGELERLPRPERQAALVAALEAVPSDAVRGAWLPVAPHALRQHSLEAPPPPPPPSLTRPSDTSHIPP